jgi:hypothetical protein
VYLHAPDLNPLNGFTIKKFKKKKKKEKEKKKRAVQTAQLG